MSASNSSSANNTTLQHPEQWKTGDEPATAAQMSYLETLTREANETWSPDQQMTKAQATIRIDELRSRTGKPAS